MIRDHGSIKDRLFSRIPYFKSKLIEEVEDPDEEVEETGKQNIENWDFIYSKNSDGDIIRDLDGNKIKYYFKEGIDFIFNTNSKGNKFLNKKGRYARTSVKIVGDIQDMWLDARPDYDYQEESEWQGEEIDELEEFLGKGSSFEDEELWIMDSPPVYDLELAPFIKKPKTPYVIPPDIYSKNFFETQLSKVKGKNIELFKDKGSWHRGLFRLAQLNQFSRIYQHLDTRDRLDGLLNDVLELNGYDLHDKLPEHIVTIYFRRESTEDCIVSEQEIDRLCLDKYTKPTDADCSRYETLLRMSIGDIKSSQVEYEEN